MAVQREIANAHIAQVLQAIGNFFQQQFERLRFAVLAVFLNGRGRHAIEKVAQLVDGHDHEVMQTEARQGFELLACPLHAFGQETFFFGQGGIGIFCTANAPQQAVCFKTCAAA